MKESQVYWWLMLDNFQICFAIVFCCLLLTVIISTFVMCAENCSKWWLITWPIMFVFLFITCFFPSSKQYALIKILPKIANSEFAKEVPEDMTTMYQMAKDYMKEKLTDKKS